MLLQSTAYLIPGHATSLVTTSSVRSVVRSRAPRFVIAEHLVIMFHMCRMRVTVMFHHHAAGEAGEEEAVERVRLAQRAKRETVF